MDGSLYDDDFYTWTKRQTAALRAVAVRDGGNAVDWQNVIEEVEALGRSQVDAVSNHLAQLMQHLVLLALVPDGHRDRPHRLGESRIFRRNAAKRYRPSMRQAVTADLDGDWAVACQAALDKLGRIAALPPQRPFTIAELLDKLPVEALVDRVRAATRQEDTP